MREVELDFRSSPTLERFFRSDKFVRAILGPVGSGKTTAACAEIFKRACEQRPDGEGMRRLRATIIRNTQPELRSTVAQTWSKLFSIELVGSEITWSTPAVHRIRFEKSGDAPGMDLEVYFLALDHPKDVKRLLSFETTMIYINEIREIERTIFEVAAGRVGRYPPAPTWSGIIADTNAWTEDHWLQGQFEKPPDNMEFFVQPPAVFDEPRPVESAIRSGDH